MPVQLHKENILKSNGSRNRPVRIGINKTCLGALKERNQL
jgi:hypothetical protein